MTIRLTKAIIQMLGMMLILMSHPLRGATNVFDAVVNHPAIPLLDEAGRHVLESNQPYSSKMSCGNGEGSGCHDYQKISSAYHFEQGRDEARDDFGRIRGLSQLVSPGYFGGYNCMGRNNPGWLAFRNNKTADDFGDFGAAGLIRECAECHAGGGWSEVDRQGHRYDEAQTTAAEVNNGDYYDRQGDNVLAWDWHKSGVMENDCMICHADLSRLRRFTPKGPERGGALQAFTDLRNRELAGGGLFRAVDSALWSFLDLRPSQPKGLSLLSFVRAGKTTDAPLSLDQNGQAILRWNPKAFNAMGKISLPMRRFPASDNCIICHKTGEDRRGFYGFGGESNPHIKDVHKGKRFTEDNGETRIINNCNACHAKRYFEAKYTNVALDADHHFPKGNGDTDVRNDLDGMPGAKSCEHCHDTAKNPALPSGQKNILSAHLQLWRTHGNLDGYSPAILEKITQSHLDTVACQTCHINRLVDSHGQPVTLNYRFRIGENQKTKIFPYQPSFRYFVQDRLSGRVLYRHERDSAFMEKTLGNGSNYIAIVDPLTRTEIGRANRTATGDLEPDSYAGFKALKQAYDRLLDSKGYAQADTRFVYVEANRYVISHNTAPSPQSVACAECHGRSANGSFSARLSPDGLLGNARTIQMLGLPDRRLVDEGIVTWTLPYLKLDNSNNVVKNVGDELYASRFESSLSALQAESTRSIAGLFKSRSADEAVGYLGLDTDWGDRLATELASREWLMFNSQVGHVSLRNVALLTASTPRSALLLGEARIQLDSRTPTPTDIQQLARSVPGTVSGDLYTLTMQDAAQAVPNFNDTRLLMMLPYSGSATQVERLRVAYSTDGKAWNTLAASDLLALNTTADNTPGHLIFRLSQPYRYLVITNRQP